MVVAVAPSNIITAPATLSENDTYNARLIRELSENAAHQVRLIGELSEDLATSIRSVKALSLPAAKMSLIEIAKREFPALQQQWDEFELLLRLTVPDFDMLSDTLGRSDRVDIILQGLHP